MIHLIIISPVTCAVTLEDEKWKNNLSYVF